MEKATITSLSNMDPQRGVDGMGKKITAQLYSQKLLRAARLDCVTVPNASFDLTPVGDYIVGPKSLLLHQAFSVVSGEVPREQYGPEVTSFLQASHEAALFTTACRDVVLIPRREMLTGAVDEPQNPERCFVGHVFSARHVVKHLELTGRGKVARCVKDNLLRFHVPDLKKAWGSGVSCARLGDQPVACTIKGSCHFMRAGDVVIAPTGGKVVYRVNTLDLVSCGAAKIGEAKSSFGLQLVHSVYVCAGGPYQQFRSWAIAGKGYPFKKGRFVERSLAFVKADLV